MTYLITRRLWDSRTGILATCILATMAAFVENFHWIRVDAALAFFVVATVWSLVEIYFENRMAWMPLAGLFLAGAFLSKGIIGPVLVGIPWAGLALIWFFSDQSQGAKYKWFIISHIWILLIFGIVAGVWMTLLYVKGGPVLWDEWFWVNQVGRFTGTAAKGHIKPGHPFYYVNVLAGNSMPWTPLVLYWFATFITGLKTKKDMSRNDIFIFVWGVGSILLLTISASKRALYLLPVMPGFAIMAAVSLKQLKSGWFKWYAGLCTLLWLLIITVILILPLVSWPIPTAVPDCVSAVLVDFSYHHAVAGLCLALLLLVMFRFRSAIPASYIMILASAGLYISLMGAPMHAVDCKKSMAADVRHFVSQVPISGRERIAGVEFSETMLGSFYYYTGWQVPQISDTERIEKILSGQDNTYDSLLVNCRDKHGNLRPQTGLVPYPYLIRSELATGSDQDRKVFWIKGQKSGSTPD